MSPTGPLAGIKVIDLTHALAGPFCTHHLQLMGAEVIKIEPPRGDDFRARPAPFAAANAGKRSVIVDMKTAEGREAVARIAAKGDVLVENYRPGVAAKLGLDWAALKTANPRLIYCSISGFGQDGPLKDMPAIESSVQAASGLLAAQLGMDAHPRSTPMLLLDPLSGYVAYAAILAALYQRQASGTGQRIDVAMADAAMMIASVGIVEAQFESEPPPSDIVGRPTVGKFAAQDRPLFIAAVAPAWFERVCDAIGRPQMKTDPRFATNAARFANADALMAEWEAGLAAKPAEAWEAELSAAGVPAAVLRTISDFASHPHVKARGALTSLRAPGRAAPIDMMGAGVRFEHDGPAFQGDVPELGADTDAVMAELGFSPEEIARLRG